MKDISIFLSFKLPLPLTSIALASVDSIGPNGVPSSVLSLTGDNIDIGQVELSRAGDPTLDSTAASNSSVRPNSVFDRAFVNFAASTNMNIPAHAEEVASIIISTDAVAKGVAPDANLLSFAGSFVNPGDPDPQLNIEAIYTQAAQSANFLATLTTHDVKAINLSIGVAGGTPNVVNGADGKSNFTSFIDWSSKTHDVSYVVAGFEAASSGSVPADNFNAITVGASDKENGVYRRVGVANDFRFDAAGNRSLIDILAPSRDVEVATLNTQVLSRGTLGGTSFAVPHVTGTLALLHQHVNNQITAGAARFTPNAHRHEVMKAVLMNSADKFIDNGTVMFDGNTVAQGGLLGMERTVLKQDGTSTWFESDAFDDFASGTGGTFFDGGAFALDTEMGAGHLNAKRALQQFIPGEYEADSTAIPTIGWDFGTTSGTSDINKYAFNQQMTAGDFISVTLAWDRKVEFDTDTAPIGVFNPGDTFKEYTIDEPNADDVISDLQLYLVPTGSFSINQAVALSIGEGTVQHIFFPIPTTDTYEIWVRQLDDDAGAQDYGLAWWYGVAPLPVVQGDFDSDGDVDGQGFLVWQRNPNVGSLSDWQSNYGNPLVAASQAASEPSAWLLLVLGVLFMQNRISSSYISRRWPCEIQCSTGYSRLI